MKDLNETAFVNLFKEACEKGLGQPLLAPLSEPDSKLLSNKIVEQTGLVIGAKSIKNYSLYILQPTEVKKENPSIATLDTLAQGMYSTLHIPKKPGEKTMKIITLIGFNTGAALPKLRPLEKFYGSRIKKPPSL